MPTPDEQVRQNRARFDALAPGYDGLGFLTLVARFLAERAGVRPGERVLDAMCGTGTVALAAVQAGAEVVGADLSERMLDVARTRAGGRATFVHADVTALPLGDGEFDAVLCASGLFFVPDMGAALREWRRVLRPGGRVVYSAFGPGLLGPLPALWRGRLETRGLRAGMPPLGRIPTPEAARALLEEAGLADVQADIHELPYVLPDAEVRWTDIAAGLEGEALGGLDEGAQAELRAEHLAELAPHFAGGPLTVPLPVIVARGVRA